MDIIHDESCIDAYFLLEFFYVYTYSCFVSWFHLLKPTLAGGLLWHGRSKGPCIECLDPILLSLNEKEIVMEEKNIIVDRGRPMTPPSSGSSGGAGSKEPVFISSGYNPGALQELLSDPSEPPFARHKAARSMVQMSKETKKKIESEYVSRETLKKTF